MLAALRDARALRAILGQEMRVASRRELQRRRNRRSVAVELGDGSCFVLKYDWRAERVAREASRLGAANLLKGIDTPKLRGSTRHHLVQDFVPGEGLDSLAKLAKGEARVALFRSAAQVLAAIHASPRAALGELELTEPCAPERLTFGEERIERLVADLGAAADGCVLGHGDFQPRHLVQAPDGRIFVADWMAMSLVTPWAELAHLLRWLVPAERDVVIAAYLEAMHKRGLLREVSAARSASLAASGLLLDHLIAAKQMVRKLGRASRPGHLPTFRASLDALAEGAG